jgi:Right handed beta helix region
MKNLSEKTASIFRFILLIVIMGMSQYATATVYYIDDVNGNDAYPGSSSVYPWQTLDNVNNGSFSPGDRIVFKRGGIWRDELSINSSGTLLDRITYSAYGVGALPIISGADLVTGTWADQGSNIWLNSNYDFSSVSYKIYFNSTVGEKENSASNLDQANEWYYENGSLYVFSDSNPGTKYTNPGIAAFQRPNVLKINGYDNLIISNINFKRGNAGTLCRVINSENVEIRGCIIEDTTENGQESGSGVIAWESPYFSLNNCIIRNCANDGVWITNNSNHSKVYNCVFTDNSFASVGDRDAIGVYKSDYVELFENDITAARRGIAFNGGRETEGGKIYRNTIKAAGTRGIEISATAEVYGNFIKNVGDLGDSKKEGIFIFGNNLGYPLHYKVYNNTLMNCEEGIELYNDTSCNSATTIKVKQNIVMNSVLRHVRIKTNEMLNLAGTEIDYNCYYPDGTEKFSIPAGLCDFDDYKDDIEKDENSLMSDPLISMTNPVLKPGSPCKNAGIDLGIKADRHYVSIPQYTVPDIGCHEYMPDPPLSDWTINDNTPTGAVIELKFDDPKTRKVIWLTGSGLDNSYRILPAYLGDDTAETLRWSMRYSEDFRIYVAVQTDEGTKYLKYFPERVDYVSIGGSEYSFGLGEDAINGRWHTFTRNLSDDCLQAGVVYIKVYSVTIKGSGRIFNMNLLDD